MSYFYFIIFINIDLMYYLIVSLNTQPSNMKTTFQIIEFGWCHKTFVIKVNSALWFPLTHYFLSIRNTTTTKKLSSLCHWITSGEWFQMLFYSEMSENQLISLPIFNLLNSILSYYLYLSFQIFLYLLCSRFSYNS